MNKLSTKAKTIVMIALAALLLAVPGGIAFAGMGNSTPLAELELPIAEPTEVIELLEEGQVIEVAPGATCPETGIRVLTHEEAQEMREQRRRDLEREIQDGKWIEHPDIPVLIPAEEGLEDRIYIGRAITDPVTGEVIGIDFDGIEGIVQVTRGVYEFLPPPREIEPDFCREQVQVIEVAPGETCPETGIRFLTPEEMRLLQGDIDVAAVESISGWLNSGRGRGYGPWCFLLGDTMIISLSWAPCASDVGLGYLCAVTGVGRVVRHTAGSGTQRIVFPDGGSFYAFIYNFGPYRIRYSGLINI